MPNSLHRNLCDAEYVPEDLRVDSLEKDKWRHRLFYYKWIADKNNPGNSSNSKVDYKSPSYSISNAIKDILVEPFQLLLYEPLKSLCRRRRH